MQTKKDQNGRSMIEMLGVLAIIGVLSVGAIAGYQKAMMKYKLNKHAHSVNYLLINALEYTKKFEKPTEGSVHYAEMMDKLGLLPDGMILKSRTTLIDTTFQHEVYVYAYPDIYGLMYHIVPTADGIEVCRNLMNIAKEQSSQLYYVQMDKKLPDGSASSHSVMFKSYGQNSCKTSTNCLAKLDQMQMDDYCRLCDETTHCRFYYVWK